MTTPEGRAPAEIIQWIREQPTVEQAVLILLADRQRVERETLERLIAHFEHWQSKVSGQMVPWQAMFLGDTSPATEAEIARAKELFPEHFSHPAPPAAGGGG